MNVDSFQCTDAEAQRFSTTDAAIQRDPVDQD